jgi:hypothetical protein
MSITRNRLVSITALTAYLVVNTGAAALHHHHHEAASWPGNVPAAGGTDLHFQTAGQAGDGDEEETCPLCSVLHLAQTLPSKAHVDVRIALTGKALSVAAIIQPHRFATPTRARSPPLA